MEVDADLALLLNYPLIQKISDEDNVVYRGSILVKDEDYKISITESSCSNFKVTLPEKVGVHEAEFDVLVAKLCPTNVVTVLEALYSFIDSRIVSTAFTNHCDVYKHILYEYYEFTRFYLNIKSCRLAHDLSKINITVLDEAGREHSFEVSVSFDDKYLFSIASYNLPPSKKIFKKSSSLKDVYEQFLRAVEALQPFFDVMDELDKNSWVLDPEQFNRSCTYRRIWMGENFSVIITLDSADVSKLPEIKFLGPERLVEKYRQTLNDNILEWEPEHGIFSEILKLLGLETFIRRPAVVEAGADLLLQSGDCSICFSARLNDKLPEVICKNKFCENCYHSECLYEWLMSVNARRFFSEVVGLCPNCEKNISCPIPK